jgi:hypothetical protein
MSMPEHSEADAATPKQATAAAASKMAEANQLAANFTFGAQKLILEEVVSAGNELAERA